MRLAVDDRVDAMAAILVLRTIFSPGSWCGVVTVEPACLHEEDIRHVAHCRLAHFAGDWEFGAERLFDDGCSVGEGSREVDMQSFGDVCGSGGEFQRAQSVRRVGNEDFGVEGSADALDVGGDVADEGGAEDFLEGHVIYVVLFKFSDSLSAIRCSCKFAYCSIQWNNSRLLMSLNLAPHLTIGHTHLVDIFH